METSLPLEPAQVDTLAYYDANAAEVAARMLAVNPEEEYQPFLGMLPPKAHILDAGCGIGRDSLFFIQRGFRVTAFDGSRELAQRASQLIRQPVQPLLFEKLDFQNVFDAIWASASLLHVPRSHFPAVLVRLENALKPNGLLYATFVYGTEQVLRGGLLFSDYTEQTFQDMIGSQSNLIPLSLWQTADLPPARPDRRWLHILLRKKV